MKIRARSLELYFAQLIPLVSILLGPVSTAIVVTLFAPEDQGHYYLLATLSVVVSLLQLGDVEGAIPQIDRRSVSSFYDALLGVAFWRITVAGVFLFIAVLLAIWTTILGTTSTQIAIGLSYLSLVALNTIVSTPHQLSQVLPVPYWQRRFGEFCVYSIVLVVTLYLVREPIALLVAGASSAILNAIFSMKVITLAQSTGKFDGHRHILRAIEYWRVFVLPGQTSSGVAHIYAQVGYRLLVPASAVPLGIVYAGQLGATLAVLGLVLGLLQQTFRVQFPTLARIHKRSAIHPKLTRSLERNAVRRLALAMLAGGTTFAIGLLIIPERLSWLTHRFVPIGDVLLLTAVLALTGICGIQILFKLAKGKQSMALVDRLVALSVLAAIFLPALLGTALGKYGFWSGAVLAPLQVLLTQAIINRPRQ